MPAKGGQSGNKNAVKEGEHRRLVTLSLKDERLKKMIVRLQQEGKEVTWKNLQQLAYEAIDAYLSEYTVRQADEEYERSLDVPPSPYLVETEE